MLSMFKQVFLYINAPFKSVHLHVNKNEITFLWGDRDRELKEDWEGMKIETTRLDCYIRKKFTLQRFAKEKYLIGNKSFGKD